jgi:hypothetical protein
LSFSLGDRARLWREDYEKLKKEVSAGAVNVPAPFFGAGGTGKPPYFHTGMMQNARSGLE